MSPDDPFQLPAANEFSPGQVNLREVLEIVDRNDGDRRAVTEDLRQTYFSDSALKQTDSTKRTRVQKTRASNVLIGMKGYGLFDSETAKLTPLGGELLRSSDEASLYDDFASHILTECHGLEVLEAVSSLKSRGIAVSKATLQGELEARGFRLPRATTHHTKLVNWLRLAHVIDAKANIDENAVERLTGVTLGTREEWAGLSTPQRAVLTTLRQIYLGLGDSSIPASELIDAAKREHGSIFKEDQLAKQVFGPLEASNWITRSTGQTGRGGKSGQISPTEKLLAVRLEAMPEGDEWGVPHDLQSKLDTPLSEIRRDLGDASKNVKGVALELLALRIASELGLIPLRFRLRADSTGGAEVDLVAEAAHLSFSRWLFQCKNTSTVPLSDLAKEVGMAEMIQANIVVVVTTGRFAATVPKFSTEFMKRSRVQVVLLDGEDLSRYFEGGKQTLLEKFWSSSQEAMRLRRAQIAVIG